MAHTSDESDKYVQMMLEQEEIDEHINNDDFDKVFLHSKQSLPSQLSYYIQGQILENPYFRQRLRNESSLKDAYFCQNNDCKTELFHSDIIDAKCKKCNNKINIETLQKMHGKMNEYTKSLEDIQGSINATIQTSLAHLVSAGIIQIIQEFVMLDRINYYVLNFDGDEYSFQKKGHLISNYIGDKKAVKIALNKIKNKLKFGDVVSIDAYGPHFVGFDEENEPKLIINPAYFGYDQDMTINTLCVPLEITQHAEMYDFLSFYHLNFINLFKANGCEKVRYFPVSMACVSYQKLVTLKERLFLSDTIFELPQDAEFYLESRNFSYIDTLHIVIDGELLSICIDQTESQQYQLSQQILNLMIQKVNLQNFLMHKNNFQDI